jgi:hypothetical protein
MSVLVDGFSVVVRNATLAAYHPGGLAGFRDDSPNATFCADEHVSRIGFTMPADAQEFVARLTRKWPAGRYAADAPALVDGHQLTQQPGDWLGLGRWGNVPLAWLAGTRRGDLHAPAGWNAERLLLHMSQDEIRAQLDFVHTKDGVETYRHRITGQLFYVGRTSRS